MQAKLERLAGLHNQNIDLTNTIKMISDVINYDCEFVQNYVAPPTIFCTPHEELQSTDDTPGIHISDGLIESIKSK